MPGGPEAGAGGIAGGDSGVEPEPGALERVGRQVHHRSTAGEQGCPVDGGAPHVHPRHPSDQGLRFGTVAAQHRGGGDVPLRAEAVLDHRREHPAGPDLEELVDAQFAQGHHRVVEPHGVPHLGDPVFRVAQFRWLGERSRAGGDEGDPRWGVGHALGDRAELGQHGFHQRRVEGVTDPDVVGPASTFGEGGREPGNGVPVPGDHQRGGAVHRREARQVAEQRRHLVLGGLDGHHRAAVGQRLHEPAAGADQRARVGQGQDPGDVRGGQLTDRVAGDEVRTQTPRLQQAVERDLDGEQRGLRVTGPGERLVVPVEQDLPQRQVQLGAHGVEGPRVGGVGGVELAAHTRVLRALPGEQERDRAVGGGADGDGRHVLSAGERPEPCPGGVQVLGRQHGAVRQRGPGGQRTADVLGSLPRLPAVQEGQQPFGLAAQGPRRSRGQHPGHQGRGLVGRPLPRWLGRGLLDDHVGVGSADAEGRHPRAPRPTGRGPLACLVEQSHRTGVPVDLGRWFVDVQGPWHDPVPHREDHLDHTSNPGGGLGVPDVGLQRTQPEGLVGGSVPAVGRDQRVGLDRVTQARSGAVRLHDVHVGPREVGGGERVTDHPLLGEPARRGQAVRRAVGVHGGAPDDRQHGMAVAAGVGQALDEQEPNPLPPARAFGAGAEGTAPPVDGQAALPGELDEPGGCRHHRDPAGDREVALAAPQRLAREVQRHQ